jgi:hypothetical protein
LAGSASAHAPPPPNDSAASQYVEAIPSAEGVRPAGGGAAKREPLPAAVSRRLQAAGGPDAALLERIATSVGLGAPRSAQPTDRRTVPRPAVESAATAIRSSLVTSVTSSGGDERLALLALGLAAISAATIFAAVRRAAPARKR